MQCLQSYVEHNYPQSPGRFSDLLTRLPEVRPRFFLFGLLASLAMALIRLFLFVCFFLVSPRVGPIGCHLAAGE